MSTETQKSQGLYYNVIDGTFRRRVQEGTPGAVKREYETNDGGKGTKHEMVIDSLEGFVHDIAIFDGDYGRTLNVKLDPNQDGVNPVIQFNVETRYGETVLRRLPKVDFKKPVKFRPYNFTNQDNGKEVMGTTVMQADEKLDDFFFDAEAKKAINGIPDWPEDTSAWTKDDIKIHFMTVRKFLIQYFTENVRPRFEKEVMEQPKDKVADTGADYPAEDIKPEDIPF